MKRMLPVLLVFSMLTPAYATRQMPDVLEYEGRTYRIGRDFYSDFPLEHYFRVNASNQQRREFLGILRSLRGSLQIPTSCWRGYVAEWSVHDRRLYLISIAPYPGDEKWNADVLRPIFGEHIEEGRLFASWFSGPIALGREALLVFEHGRLIRVLSFSNGEPNAVVHAHRELLERYSKHPPAGEGRENGVRRAPMSEGSVFRTP